MLVGHLTRQEAEDLLHHCLVEGEVKYGRHFPLELMKEKVTIVNAWHVLSKGRIYQEGELDVRTREWKYRVEGNEPEGKWLAIVFSFKTKDLAFLITVFSVEGRSTRS